MMNRSSDINHQVVSSPRRGLGGSGSGSGSGTEGSIMESISPYSDHFRQRSPTSPAPSSRRLKRTTGNIRLATPDLDCTEEEQQQPVTNHDNDRYDQGLKRLNHSSAPNSPTKSPYNNKSIKVHESQPDRNNSLEEFIAKGINTIDINNSNDRNNVRYNNNNKSNNKSSTRHSPPTSPQQQRQRQFPLLRPPSMNELRARLTRKCEESRRRISGGAAGIYNNSSSTSSVSNNASYINSSQYQCPTSSSDLFKNPNVVNNNNSNSNNIHYNKLSQQQSPFPFSGAVATRDSINAIQFSIASSVISRHSDGSKSSYPANINSNNDSDDIDDDEAAAAWWNEHQTEVMSMFGFDVGNVGSDNVAVSGYGNAVSKHSFTNPSLMYTTTTEEDDDDNEDSARAKDRVGNADGAALATAATPTHLQRCISYDIDDVDIEEQRQQLEFFQSLAVDGSDGIGEEHKHESEQNTRDDNNTNTNTNPTNNRYDKLLSVPLPPALQENVSSAYSRMAYKTTYPPQNVNTNTTARSNNLVNDYDSHQSAITATTTTTPSEDELVASSPISQNQHQHQHLYENAAEDEVVLIEVLPGVRMSLKAPEDTWRAVMSGRITVTSCTCCECELTCADDAEVVVCTDCWVFSPVDQSVSASLSSSLRSTTSTSTSSSTSSGNHENNPHGNRRHGEFGSIDIGIKAEAIFQWLDTHGGGGAGVGNEATTAQTREEWITS